MRLSTGWSPYEPQRDACRDNVFVEKIYDRTDGPWRLLKWGRNFWWTPGWGDNILCRVSRPWVKTWLLVCNRMKILPKGVVLKVASWIANTHTCHAIKIEVRLGHAKELGVPFVCDPEFQPFPKCTCYGTPRDKFRPVSGHWGPNVYAGVGYVRTGCPEFNEPRNPYPGIPGPPPTIDPDDIIPYDTGE